MLNVDQPDYGHILDNMVLQDAAVFRVGELIQPKIEPEIAFILDQELKGPGITPTQVLAATRFVVPALEIIDSRIEGWKIKLCDTIADNASSARVVAGNSPKRVDQFDLKLVGMVLEKNGDIVQTGAGGAVLGHPAVAVAWLANAVGQFGVSLSAGDIIMPGALCGAADVGAGDLLQAIFRWLRLRVGALRLEVALSHLRRSLGNEKFIEPRVDIRERRGAGKQFSKHDQLDFKIFRQ